MYSIIMRFKHAAIAVLFLVLSIAKVTAQVKIGLPAGVPNADAILDISNTAGGNKGFMYPQVALVSTTSPAPLAAMVAGMAVYNTAVSGTGSTAVSPGLYISDGNSWLPVALSTIPATFTSSLDCAGTLAVQYETHTPISSLKKQFTITVAAQGAYTASTTTVNGVSFSAIGQIAAGNQTITLTASGTPTSSGTFSYPVTISGQTCSFDVNYYTLNFACSGAILSLTPAGPLVNGTNYTGTYTLPYTSTVNGANYAAASQAVSGLTLTRVPGTYSAATGSSVVYNLSGMYTGISGVNALFTIPECSNIQFGDAISMALTTNYTIYANAAANTWVSITAAEYANIAAGVSGIVKYGMPDNTFNNVSRNFPGGYTLSQSSLYTGIPISNYPIAMKIEDYTAPTTMAGIQLKLGTAINSGYVDFPATGTVTPNAATAQLPLASNTKYYWVLKSPTNMTSASVPSYVALYAPISNQLGLTILTNELTYYILGSNSPSTSFNAGTAVQVLATPTKSW